MLGATTTAGIANTLFLFYGFGVFADVAGGDEGGAGEDVDVSVVAIEVVVEGAVVDYEEFVGGERLLLQQPR